MSNIAKNVGQQIRNYRINQKLSQEKLAEMSGLHPTYIGQLERGEKNATLESIEKISSALNIPLSQLFENLSNNELNSTPLKGYELLLSKSKSEQEELYNIMLAIDKYKNI